MLMDVPFAARLARVSAPVFAMVIALLVSGCGVTAIPSTEDHAKLMWGELVNQYQRRADLVPGLVESVRAYAPQARDTLATAMDASNTANAAPADAAVATDADRFRQYQAAQAELGRAIEQVFALSGTYPDLKSSQTFLALQAQLGGVDNRIAVARRDYVRAVQAYNKELSAMPGLFWAATVYRGRKPMEILSNSADKT